MLNCLPLIIQLEKKSVALSTHTVLISEFSLSARNSTFSPTTSTVYSKLVQGKSPRLPRLSTIFPLTTTTSVLQSCRTSVHGLVSCDVSCNFEACKHGAWIVDGLLGGLQMQLNTHHPPILHLHVQRWEVPYNTMTTQQLHNSTGQWLIIGQAKMAETK